MVGMVQLVASELKEEELVVLLFMFKTYSCWFSFWSEVNLIEKENLLWLNTSLLILKSFTISGN